MLSYLSKNNTNNNDNNDNNENSDKDILLSLRTLIIDNYDSYTFNLLQLWNSKESLNNVVVIRNDQFSWIEFKENILPYFDNIIISPGPGSPENNTDFGICKNILELDNIPILGICLGHQGIGLTFGGKVTNAKRIMHGRLSSINHDGSFNPNSLFYKIPSPFLAVRYHSLVIDNKELSSELIISAWCSEDENEKNNDLQECSLNAINNSFNIIDTCNDTSNSIKLSIKEANSTIMGLQHVVKPIYGVQFHPESICTEHGFQILRNFQSISREFLIKTRGISIPHQKLPEHIKSLSVVPKNCFKSISDNSENPTTASSSSSSSSYKIIMKILNKELWIDDSSLIFQKIVSVGKSKCGVWWLDSAKLPDPQSRFSYMGSTPTISNSFSTSYDTLSKKLIITYSNNKNNKIFSEEKLSNQTYWDWMSETMQQFNQRIIGLRVLNGINDTNDMNHMNNMNDNQRIPFDFRLGMVGYFGYEMKRESLRSYQQHHDQSSSVYKVPDAAFIFATQAIIFDHVEKRIWLAGLVRNDLKDSNRSKNNCILDIPLGYSFKDFISWINLTEKKLKKLKQSNQSNQLNQPNQLNQFKQLKQLCSIQNIIKTSSTSTNKNNKINNVNINKLNFIPDLIKDLYLGSIEKAQSYIYEGQSYEICLTTQFRASMPKQVVVGIREGIGERGGGRRVEEEVKERGEVLDIFELYQYIRTNNPAPFSALIHFPTEDLSIFSSSPEKFLQIDNKGVIEMKPIKGTIARAKGCFCLRGDGDDGDVPECDKGVQCEMNRKKDDMRRINQLIGDVKEQAENLMIVDLIRNDLSQICLPHTVKVPSLMKIESYETVHQLVTTVQGNLRNDLDCVNVIRGCFPPGSMTGAPKLRSVQLLDELEDYIPRGVYSGCLGYISLHDGTTTGEGGARRGRGTAKFNVIIRTVVIKDGKEISIGAGGAIVYLSNRESEWKEVLLKSQSVLPSVLEFMKDKRIFQ
ncbi:hypothetical protein Glove_82g79 [Diversispora epigaea]|uniref:aminodeoxychorismate synthase n=1 Tax=Diversispora epigaea TaxID=1348612 RepID=A0A397JGX2_9GLOM|nr:hypothetical protein Glove_82g79 [Diversispora epigaea]